MKHDLFKETIFSFGTVKENDTVEFEFEFQGNKEDIQYIDKGCGCTDAYFEDGKIKGTLDISKASRYNPGLNPVNKYIHVYLNDGRGQYKADEKLRRVIDNDKESIRLQVAGMVEKPEDTK